MGVKNLEIAKGTILRSNDPRRPVDITVIGVEKTVDNKKVAVYQAGRRKARIGFNLIYDDGHERTRGWSVVHIDTDAETAPA